MDKHGDHFHHLINILLTKVSSQGLRERVALVEEKVKQTNNVEVVLFQS